MTFTGKLLIVFILIMSLVFMSFSVMTFATHRNWKELVENDKPTPDTPLGMKHQIENRTKEIEQLEIEKDRLETYLRDEQEDKNRRVAQLETAINQLLGTVSALRDEKATLVESEREKVAAFAVLQKTLDERRIELETVRTEIIDSHRSRDEHFANVIKLRDEVNMMQNEMSRLATRRDELTKQITQLDRILAYHDISRLDPDVYKKPPKVEGKITALDAKEKLVEISLGSDDGIQRDHELEVFRLGDKARYLGKIRVIKSEPDRAVAKIVPGTIKGAFERDDHVATSLR